MPEMNYFRDRDGQPARRAGAGRTEVLAPDGEWIAFAVDTAHDAVPRTIDEAKRDAAAWLDKGAKLPEDLAA